MDIGLLVNAPPQQVHDDSQSESDDGVIIKWNCNQIRTKLNAFVNSGAMRVGELQEKLGVTSKSYLSFMRQNGPHAGSGSNTYYEAHKFFSKREAQGLKMPKPAKALSKAEEDTKYNVDGVELPVGASGNVEIYDSCDDIRTKISAHLRTSGQTQAAFLRMIAAASGVPPIQSKQLTDFTRKKGALSGNTSKVFYAAYIYFEKLRLKNKKPKSKKRLQMEEEWAASGGVDTSRVATGMVWAHESESVWMNNLGGLEVTSRGGHTRVHH